MKINDGSASATETTYQCRPDIPLKVEISSSMISGGVVMWGENNPQNTVTLNAVVEGSNSIDRMLFHWWTEGSSGHILTPQPQTSPEVAVTFTAEHGSDFSVSVNVTQGTRTPSTASITVRTVAKPSGGECTLYPSSGQPLATRFAFKCSGWQSNMGTNLTYLVTYQKATGQQQIVAEQVQPSGENVTIALGVFPLSSYNLSVLVQDTFSAQVKLPPVNLTLSPSGVAPLDPIQAPTPICDACCKLRSSLNRTLDVKVSL